jgi:hypothetical protein
MKSWIQIFSIVLFKITLYVVCLIFYKVNILISRDPDSATTQYPNDSTDAHSPKKIKKRTATVFQP